MIPFGKLDIQNYKTLILGFAGLFTYKNLTRNYTLCIFEGNGFLEEEHVVPQPQMMLVLKKKHRQT